MPEEQDLPDGSTEGCPASQAADLGARTEDQPTVISKRPPLPVSPSADSSKRLEPSEIPPGARLGHFELLEYVGGGGMGRVFRALDTRLGRTVALKALSRHQASDLDTLMRFRNEARSAARLNHPGIAQVFFVGEDDGLPFIAFEFVEGPNIRDLVGQKGPLSLVEALSYTLQVAEALTHAAARNVVHRDIKPSNLLITSEGRAKLIDMGLARMRKLGSGSADLTASGVTLGTFDYISPEQARDPRNADIRSDIYSLGCTLFFMLTGRPPFPEGTVLQKLLQHQEIEAPDVRQFRPDLPDEVSRLLRKMMAKEPHRRYQDSAKLIESLLALADQMGLRPRAGQMAWSEPEEPRGALLRRQLPWMVPAAALVLIVALLNVLWSSPPEQTQPSWSSRSRDGQAAQAEPAGSDRAPAADAEDRAVPSAKPAAVPEPVVPASKTAVADAASAESPGPPAGQSPAAKAQPVGPAVPGAEAQAPVRLAAANPLSAVGSPSGPTGLRPESFAGGLAYPELIASGLSPSAPPGTDWGELNGATPTATELADARPTAERAPSGSRALIVDLAGESESTFALLSAACDAARPGDVIELRFNGRLEEEPLELANTELTIRGAEGYQPVVAFRPSEIDPIGYPRSMFALIGSRLELANVQIEFDLARELPSDRWALFEMGQGEKLRLANCGLTIRNAADRRAAYHQEVAFFRLQAAPGSELLIDGEPGETTGPVEIELVDSVARGEADLLRVEDLRPVRLDWTNGFLVTPGRLLVAHGGERAPPADDSIEVNLRRVTAVVDAGLCRFHKGEFAPHRLPAIVSCVDSLVLLEPAGSLIDQVGPTAIEPSEGRFSWVGENNVYQGFADFWTVRPLDPAAPAQTWDFDAWRDHWNETTSRLGRIDPDELPSPDRPCHALQPTDYPSVQGTRETTTPPTLPPDPPPESDSSTRHRPLGFQVGG